MRGLRLCLFLLLLVGCNDEKFTEVKVEGIARIFMHEPDQYSFLVSNEPSGPYRLVTFRNLRPGEIHFEADVPDTLPMWVTMSKVETSGVPYYTNIIIHIRSPRSVEGGGWNHGKRGRGNTNIIR